MLDQPDVGDGRPDAEAEELPALLIAWCAAEAGRVGEVAIFEDARERIFGAGEAGPARVAFVQQRPDRERAGAPIQGRRIALEQLRLSSDGDSIRFERIGRCPVLRNGRTADRGALAQGDTLLLQSELLLLCTRRPRRIEPLLDFPDAGAVGFGEPDAHGLLGESPAAWRLRDRLAFAAMAHAHVLLLGESGTGKELAARAIHRLSGRAGKPLVARNAATFPAGLIDAELFGNVRNYPNPGMADRPGLIGQADGGTLFLDEIGELPSDLQSHLLRVLDAGGEYHRLGEASPRRADLRLIAATNRPAETLKHDLLARVPLRIVLPGLGERRDDIPLLVRHLLRAAANRSPEIGRRFAGEGPTPSTGGAPRLDVALLDLLIRHHYTAHVRELEGLLWRAMADSRAGVVALTNDVLAQFRPAPGPPPRSPRDPLAAAPPPEPDVAAIRSAVDRASGNLAQAARTLGLSSRYALYRLLRKHGIEVGSLRDGPDGEK